MCEAHDKVLVDGNGDELRNDEKKSRHGCNGCGDMVFKDVHKNFVGMSWEELHVS